MTTPMTLALWCSAQWPWLLMAANGATLLLAALLICRGTSLAPLPPRAWLAVALTAGSVFGGLAHLHTASTALASFDSVLAAALGETIPLDTLRHWVAVTHLGDGVTRALLGASVAIALCWRRQPRWLTLWVVTVGGIGLVNQGLKYAFERARPLRAHDLIIETSWSFPSGHASGAAATYGLLALWLVGAVPSGWRAPAVLAGCLIILNVGFSRVLLQVHYASDVMAGFAVGIGWLALCCAAAGPLRTASGS